MSNKIVFLDSSTVDYGDVDLSLFSDLGDFVKYDITEKDELFDRVKDATVAISNKVVFDKEILNKCKKLKLIAVAATGYNIIDTETSLKNGIAVVNVPGYSTYSVAQLTMTFVLSLATSLIKYNSACHDGTWSKSKIFTLGNWPTFDLKNKTIGILGFGDIGKQVASFCKVFGMNVVALKREGVDYDDGIRRLSLDEITEEADFISVHMPLSDFSNGLINKDFFKKMKKSAYLLNMARGPIVEPEALCHALESGEIAGAAIDVMEKEPPDDNNKLLKVPNLIMTPHVAWASLESRTLLISEIAQNIKAFFSGEERNRVG